MNVQELYKHLPVALQNAACSIYGYKEKFRRYGDWFEYWHEQLVALEFSGSERIEAYQEAELQQVITNAYENVPYYRALFKRHKLQPSDIKSSQDLYKIPVLTKEIINEDLSLFINNAIPKRELIKNKTSGTTGSSLKFYTTKEALSFQWAVWWRHRMRFGFNFGDRHLNFTGRPVVPSRQTSPPYWRWNYAFNQALISMQAIRKDTVNDLCAFINRHDFKYWVGAPSIIHNFCSLLQDQNIELSSKPEVIFLGVENLYDFQRRDIQQVTKAVVTDQYGFAEGCGNASQCKEFRHHIDFEFGILECEDPESLPDKGRKGAIICTGFANKALPFIRYRVGDIGIWESPGLTCSCGRNTAILKRIEGRIEDYIITPEGRKVMRFDYLFKETDQVKEAQVVQHEPGKITINIVKRANYSVKTERNIRKDVFDWISPSFEIEFQYLKEIPREKSGKFRAVKSELK